LKKEWSEVRLGEVVTPVERPEVPRPGTVYRQIGVKLWGVGAYERKQLDGGATKYATLFRAEAGDVIVNKIWARNGSVAVVPDALAGCYGSGEFPIFSPDRIKLDPRWIHWLTKTPEFWAQCDEKSQGTSGQNRIRPERFLEIRIPLPPLVEQRRVVARIEDLAAQIHEARSLRQQAEREAAALPLSVAHSMLAAVDSLRTRLGDWVDTAREGIQTGPFGAQLNSSEFTEIGTPVLTIGNVQYGGLDTANLRFISEMKAAQLARYQVSEGDILFARMGTVGRCCVVPSSAHGWLINYHIIRVALDKQRIDPQFVHWTIRASTDVECYLQERIRGATREGVNSEIVAGLPCRVPPLSEQRRIVAELDALQAETNRLKRSQGESAGELDTLLPAILDRAFKGEL